MTFIYNIDTDKEVTSTMVRDAIVDCFYDAHCGQTGFDSKDSDKLYCTQIVKKAFTETNGDFDKPSKESLLATLPWLANFSKDFRNQEVIQEHFNSIMLLINLIK